MHRAVEEGGRGMNECRGPDPKNSCRSCKYFHRGIGVSHNHCDIPFCFDRFVLTDILMMGELMDDIAYARGIVLLGRKGGREWMRSKEIE